MTRNAISQPRIIIFKDEGWNGQVQSVLLRVFSFGISPQDLSGVGESVRWHSKGKHENVTRQLTSNQRHVLGKGP
eukprot:1142745-Pelagomonas_calceolata.AAC.2